MCICSLLDRSAKLGASTSPWKLVTRRSSTRRSSTWRDGHLPGDETMGACASPALDRDAKSCLERWKNYLRLGIKTGSLTGDE
jgi:hypothetical protein